MVMEVSFDEVFENVMMNAVIAACDDNGVISGLAVSQNGAGASMHVDVSNGFALIGGTTYVEITSTEDLVIAAAHATLDRKDLVTYDPTTSAPIVTTGVAAAIPEPPDIPAGDILLAIVDIGAAVTQITNANITDGRVFVSIEVDGCGTGTSKEDVYKIPAFAGGEILHGHATDSLNKLVASTDGHQLTTHTSGSDPTWAAASDLIFSDTHCPKCGLEFQDGDDLILHVIGHNEVGDILTIPMHKDCAEAPKKTVTIKRKNMEDQYTLDELTGELKVQRVRKMREKTIMKHKMKEGYVLDNKSGKAYKIDEDGNRGETKYTLSEVLETVEETISEVVMEDVEYEL